MRGAELGILPDEADASDAAERLLDLVRLVAHHDQGGSRLQCRRGPEHVPQEGPAGEPVQHLRPA